MATSKEKQAKFDEFMKFELVFVHLDARATGVVVPPHLADNPALTLQLSYRFQGETSYDDDAVTSYLKFAGDYFECVMPWTAIWGFSIEKGPREFWPEDAPKEVLLTLVKEQVGDIKKRLFRRKESGKETAEEPAASAEKAEKPSKAKPSHLRVVK